MPSTVDALIARLQADNTALEAAERTVRAGVGAQLKKAERARAFAWRRLSALVDTPPMAALEPEPEIAVERQLVALSRDNGWIDDGMDELEGARPLLDWRRLSRTRCAPGPILPLTLPATSRRSCRSPTGSRRFAPLKTDRLALNRGRCFDRTGRLLRIDEVA